MNNLNKYRVVKKIESMSFSGLIIILIFSFYSCKTSEQIIEQKIAQCVNETTNFSKYNKSGQGDFYTMMEDVEKLLLVQKESKEDYNKTVEDLLVNKDEIGKELFDKINKVFDKYGYIPQENNHKIFTQCPFFVLVTEKNEMKSSLYFQSQLLNGIQASGYEDIGLIKELISSTSDDDFKKIIYRTPIILVIVNSLDNIYGTPHSSTKTFDFSK